MPFTEDYAAELRKGASFELWIADANADLCPVNRVDLGLEELDEEDWTITQETMGLPEGYSTESMRILELPSRQYRSLHIRCMASGYEDIRWIGRLAKGVLFLEDVYREKGVDGPYISELSIAAYREAYDLVSLKSIFVANIVNDATRPILEFLCPQTRVTVCEYATQGYTALLGSEIGTIVACIVLGAFERGTVRIARITLWWTGPFREYGQARFDIERI